MGKTYAYTYDKAGNIRSKKTYNYTTGTLGTAQSSIIYRYNTSGWKDQLKKYDGVELTYDATGNPLQYYNGAEYTFTWKNGRELATSAKGGVTTTYTYDESGNRISKQVGNVTHTYVYEGSQLISDSFSGKYVVYIYDESGSPAGMEWHENNTVSKYAFEKNLHGDIVGIYTYAGTKVVTYKYDAWGNCTADYLTIDHTVADTNIFRYRGYIYDTETGFYWLRTRYYDPVIGRFINADSLLNGGDELQGYNMYAYCGNNPVMYVDPTGNFWGVIGIILICCFILCIPGDTDQSSYYEQEAKKLYNGDTVAVYERGDILEETKSVNVEFYHCGDAEEKTNISIDISLNINSSYEQNAVLDVIIDSPFYSEEVFGSKKYMRAQWQAHNACYNIATSSRIGYWFMQLISGSSNPIESSESLDLRSKNNVNKKTFYLFNYFFF